VTRPHTGPIEDADQDSGTRALIDDLLAKPRSFARDEILRRARRLRYHSFKGVYAMPEVELVRHLNAAGFADLATNVTQGKYDQPPDEGRRWAEETEEGRAMMAMVNADPELKAQMDQTMKALGKAKKEGRLDHLTSPEAIKALGKSAPWKIGS